MHARRVANRRRRVWTRKPCNTVSCVWPQLAHASSELDGEGERSVIAFGFPVGEPTQVAYILHERLAIRHGQPRAKCLAIHDSIAHGCDGPRVSDGVAIDRVRNAICVYPRHAAAHVQYQGARRVHADGVGNDRVALGLCDAVPHQLAVSLPCKVRIRDDTPVGVTVAIAITINVQVTVCIRAALVFRAALVLRFSVRQRIGVFLGQRQRVFVDVS